MPGARFNTEVSSLSKIRPKTRSLMRPLPAQHGVTAATKSGSTGLRVKLETQLEMPGCTAWLAFAPGIYLPKINQNTASEAPEPKITAEAHAHLFMSMAEQLRILVQCAVTEGQGEKPKET